MKRQLVGFFEHEADLIEATRTARESNYGIVDVYTPYALHGLDRAMGLPPSRLSLICFLFGLFGAAFALAFQFWTSALDWPINVGGKPWNSLPAFVPVTFELMVLFGGLGTVLAFLVVNRLRPGKRPVAPVEGVTDDRFALAVDVTHEMAAAGIRRLFTAFNAVEVEERHVEPSGTTSDAQWRYALNTALFLMLAGALYALWGPGANPAQPHFEVLPQMAHTVRYNAFEANPVFPDSVNLRLPPEGTIPRGVPPLHYGTTPEEALRAGEELRNPFDPADDAALARGADRYAVFCQPCHGLEGRGDGVIGQRGYPPPPPLVSERAAGFADGHIFHIITYGQASMPSHATQIPRDDRWKIILHVRQLQQHYAPASGGEQP